MAAIETQGTKLYFSTSTSQSTAAGTLVGQVVSFTGPGGEAPDIDVTHLNSTAREYLVGLRDEGNFTFQVLYDASDTSQAYLRTARAGRLKRKVTLDFSTVSIPTATAVVGSRLTFDAYCKGFSYSGSIDDKVMADVSLRITGDVDSTVQTS